jgi:GNAT superfamily N-acetyltransferase
MPFNISPLSPKDLPALLELIRELAQFEKLAHEVQATHTSLHDSFFSPQPAAGAFLARRGSDLAGYAIYYFTFSSFVGRPGIWLDDVYVRPQFRGQGLGRAFFRAVAQVGVERKCGRFEWTALNWNEKALGFYRKLGAHTMNEWLMLRLDAAGLQRLAQTPTR